MVNNVLIAFFGNVVLVTLALSGQNGPPIKTDVETRVIEVGTRGFQPLQLLWPAKGKHMIFVRNTTKLQPLVLRLNRDQGPKLKEVPLGDNHRHWKELLELAPGTYFLTEANHPAWKCMIVVSDGK